MTSALRDLVFALRALRKSPGFGITALFTLALSIGASTAVFTVVDSVILKPLAYRDSGRLVVAWERVRFLGGGLVGPNPRHMDVWRQRAAAFQGLTFFRVMAMGIAAGGDHPQLTGAVVCIPNLFDILEVHPLFGRTFIPEDGAKGHDNVAVITYSSWQNLFHADPAIVGKTLRLDDSPRQVIGVLPPEFRFPNANALRAFHSKQALSIAPEPAVFFPGVFDLRQFEWNGNFGNWIVLGRLNPGVTVREAEAQINVIQAQIAQDHQRDRAPGALLANLEPMQEAIVGSSRAGLWLLMAAVASLVLIACLNLANAQLSRSLAARRDAAVRAALGASKSRLVWTALAENLILAATGGACGILLASIGLSFFRRYTPIDLPRLSEAHPDLAVLCFTIAVTIGASLISGVLPALRTAAADPQAALQSGNRAFGSQHGNALRAWLIGLQVFGCTALLLVTGLFAKSLLNLLRQDKGFDTTQVSIADVRLAPKTYGAAVTRMSFDAAVLANLRSLPGVQSASLVSAMPLEGESWIEPAGRPDMPHLEGPLINLRWASPGYFEATRQRLVAGRFFDDRDQNLETAIISESEAKALWGVASPIGGQIRLRGKDRTVIGVVADSHNASLKTAPPKMAYLHYKDQPPYTIYFVVRSAQPVESTLPAIRQAIWRYAPDVNIARVKTLDAQVADSLATDRFQTMVLTTFGVSALLLAMLGIYGVLSYSMVARRQEIGVRMALGASRSKIYALTFTGASIPVIAGLAAGLAGSAVGGRVIQKLLYGVQPVDPVVIASVAALFLIAAGAAAFLPARRAASVDPMEALRSE